jgi:hypothetical protein
MAADYFEQEETGPDLGQCGKPSLRAAALRQSAWSSTPMAMNAIVPIGILCAWQGARPNGVRLGR